MILLYSLLYLLLKSEISILLFYMIDDPMYGGYVNIMHITLIVQEIVPHMEGDFILHPLPITDPGAKYKILQPLGLGVQLTRNLNHAY